MFKFCPFCGVQINKQSKNGFQCPNCKKWTHYSSIPAVVVAVRVKNEALVVVRGIDPGKGCEDMVGGFLEYGEDPLDGAIREFEEEVGVKLTKDKLRLLGMWMGDYLYQGNNNLVLNIIYFIELDQKFAGNPADDVAELKWVPLSYKPNFAFDYLYEAWEKIKTS